MVFASRFRAITLAMLAALVGSACGPRLAPRIQVPAEQTDQTAYRDAYTAFWWNCAIVKSIDLNARCPNTCTGAPAATAGCSAGAADAQDQIADLEKKHGPVRTREILSLRIGEDDGYSHLRSYFPYGPKLATDN
jgi:hypothetical protein